MSAEFGAPLRTGATTADNTTIPVPTQTCLSSWPVDLKAMATFYPLGTSKDHSTHTGDLPAQNLLFLPAFKKTKNSTPSAHPDWRSNAGSEVKFPMVQGRHSQYNRTSASI